MRVAEVALARRTEVTRAERRCPHCGTAGAHLHGRDKNDRQRFRCRTTECRRSFNILTGTPMARARKPEKWGHYPHSSPHFALASFGMNTPAFDTASAKFCISGASLCSGMLGMRS